MERNALGLFVRLGQVLLGALLMVQMVMAQAPAANIAVKSDARPMARDASPDFLVATIKPSDPGSPSGWGFPTDGNHVACVNATPPGSPFRYRRRHAPRPCSRSG